MSRAIEIIDPDGERRLIRHRRIFFVACVASICLFGYPEAKDFFPKWRALKAGQKLALYLTSLRTKAILGRSPVEARFRAPDLVEVAEVTTCGPAPERKKIAELRLSELEDQIEFAPEAWIRENAAIKEPILARYCYDPAFGSSVFLDGLAHGGIFLVHRHAKDFGRGDQLVQLMVEGATGDIEIE